MKKENKVTFYSLQEAAAHYRKLHPSKQILVCSENLLDRAKELSSPDWLIVPVEGFGNEWVFCDINAPNPKTSPPQSLE